MSSEPMGGVESLLRAAGGVVARVDPDRGTEVVLVHRPRFDDWSLPKGKLKGDEHPVTAAVREVGEEAGVRAVVGARLPTVHYDVWTGDELVQKSVDYWAMTVTGEGVFTPGSEVDDLIWLPVEQALTRASYPHDRRVLRAYAELPMLTRPILLLRHGSAGKQTQWPGPDRDRPLDEHGQAQAAALAIVVACFAPATLISAEPVRCQQTLAPLAQSMNLPIEVDPVFNDEAAPELAAARLRELAVTGQTIVVCSQGVLIPPVVGMLHGTAATRYRTMKGAGWALSFGDRGRVVVDAITVDRH